MMLAGSVGTYGNAAPYAGQLVRASYSGSNIWIKTVANNAYHSSLHGLGALPGGDWVAYGGRTIDSVTRPWLVRFDASGNVLAERMLHQETGLAVAALVGVASDRFVLVGHVSEPTGGHSLTLSWRNLLGNELFGRRYPVTSGTTVTIAAKPLVSLPAGQMAILGNLSGFGVVSPYIIKTDHWGTETCLDGVKCAGLKVEDCADGDPCTVGYCHAAKGCLKGVLACDDGDACTNSHACAGGACTGQKVICDDGNVCTDDSCDVVKGCIFSNNTGACTDDDACTTQDACKSGQCVAAPLVCDDGNDCTVDACDKSKGCTIAQRPKGSKCAAACGAGVCGAADCEVPSGPSASAGWSWPTPGLKNADAVCELPGGGFAMAGCAEDGGVVILRVDDKGANKAPAATLAGLKCTAVIGMQARSDGGLVIVFSRNYPSHTSAMVGLSPANKQVWFVAPVVIAGAFAYPRHVAWLDGGQTAGLVVYVRHDKSGVYTLRSYLQRVDTKTGAKVGALTYFGETAYETGSVTSRTRVLADGSFVAMGQRWTKASGKPWQGWMMRLTSTGASKWAATVDTPSASWLGAALQLPDKGFLASGTETQGPISKRLLARLDQAGKLQWWRSWPGAADISVAGMRMVGLGAAALLGSTTTAEGKAGLALFHIDLLGNVYDKRIWLPGGDATATAAYQQALALPSDGGFALLGTRKAYGKAAPFLVRGDVWGHPSCQGAGKCADKTVKDCDDGKACTLATCLSADGCGHPMASCDDGNPCTTDACKADSGCASVAVPAGKECGDGKSCNKGVCQ